MNVEFCIVFLKILEIINFFPVYFGVKEAKTNSTMQRVIIILLVFLMDLAKEISAEQYVRGGTKAKHGDIPYIATIHHGHCQGVILNQYSVLMNSICTASCHNSNCKIMVGLTELQPENGEIVDVTNIVWNPCNSTPIAIFHTSQIGFSKKVLTTRLPTSDFGGYKTQVMISGWYGLVSTYDLIFRNKFELFR